MHAPKSALGLVLLATSSIYACGASDSATTFGAEAPSGAADAGTGPSGNGGASAVDAGPPPEKEIESSFQAPVATGNFVWVANPASGRVAYIDAKTLEVKVAFAGNGPTQIAALPSTGAGSGDATVVLNALSHDATLLRAKDGVLERKTFAVGDDANKWSVSKDGRWAIAWSDASLVPGAAKSRGFQDLTVIDVTGALPPQILSVGYRPTAVGFDGAGKLAYAVTEDGVALLELSPGGGAAPRLVRNVPLGSDGPGAATARDVSVTPDLRFAFVRRTGDAKVGVVPLDGVGAAVDVTLDGPVTDLDLAEDGSKAVAVVRETGKVFVLPVPAIATKPLEFASLPITGETVGSVSLAPAGDRALLYTTATPVERLSVLSLAPALSFRALRLYAPVAAVFPAPAAANAVVLHTTGSDGLGAFSLVPVADTLPAKIVQMNAPPFAVSVRDDLAIVAERNDTTRVYGAWIARFPSFRTEHFPLASAPLAVGVVPSAGRAFVSQMHPEGRITFFDLATGAARTLTGFELASRVVTGGTP